MLVVYLRNETSSTCRIISLANKVKQKPERMINEKLCLKHNGRINNEALRKKRTLLLYHLHPFECARSGVNNPVGILESLEQKAEYAGLPGSRDSA